MAMNFALAPSAAILIGCVARYRNTLASRILSTAPVIALGNASYSIYLFHFLVILIVAQSFPQELSVSVTNVAFVVFRFVLVLLLIMLLSLGLYATVELPAKRWLRGLVRSRAGRVERPLAGALAAASAMPSRGARAAVDDIEVATPRRGLFGW
jgi:peptidoglycan/LPS O-acetylase OafA/YrhL